MNVRFPLALPFTVLAALAVGCSSSSSPETTDGGVKNDTGTVKLPDGGGKKGDTGTTTKHDTGAPTLDGGSTPDTGTTPTPDGGVSVTPAANSTMIASGIRQVVGMTTDDYIVYYDVKGGISASDIMGNITQIAPGPTTDGGISGTITNIGGNIVAYLTDYSTRTVTSNGQSFTEAYKGTLFIWSHTLNKSVQIATNANGLISVAADSSYVSYIDGSDTSATVGNIGVAAGDGTGSIDILTHVLIDEESTSCTPNATFDKAYVVVSACAISDAGVPAKPTVTSFNGAGTPVWTSKVLEPVAGTSNLATPPGSVNFVTDTGGFDVLTVSGTTPNVLSVQGLDGTNEATVIPSIGAPASGSEFFYLSNASTFALFTTPGGSLGKATFATPSSAPSVSNLVTATDAGVGAILGVVGISGDEKYAVEYTTAPDPMTTAPTSLNLLNIATGTAVPLITPGSADVSTFFGINTFTADYSYVVFTSDLTAVGSDATVGSLETADVATGTVNILVPSSGLVWDANSLTGTLLIYNQNYIPNTQFMVPNGAATGDIYVADAAKASPGTLIVSGADAPDGFYVTQDKSHMFYSFSQVVAGVDDAGTTVGLPVAGDGIYSVAIPTP